MAAPPVLFKYNTNTSEATRLESERAPFDQRAYVTDEMFVTSTGGARVPLFVAHRKGIHLNGENPALITGYGGFGDSYYPSWQSLSAEWLKLGGVFAIACVRGGGEYGAEWHRAGMLGNKQHSFDDFAAAANALVRRGFTRHGLLAAYGRGLVAGVTEIEHPTLFHAVADDSGPVDVLRGYTYGSEAVWGNEVGLANHSAREFQWLYGYAPLPKIQRGVNYPATFVMTSENDERVSPAHSYKFAASLQWATDGTNPVLLYVAAQSGHIGGPLRAESRTLADTEAFLWSQLQR